MNEKKKRENLRTQTNTQTHRNNVILFKYYRKSKIYKHNKKKIWKNYNNDSTSIFCLYKALWDTLYIMHEHFPTKIWRRLWGIGYKRQPVKNKRKVSTGRTNMLYFCCVKLVGILYRAFMVSSYWLGIKIESIWERPTESPTNLRIPISARSFALVWSYLVIRVQDKSFDNYRSKPHEKSIHLMVVVLRMTSI